jgi:GNAT superfamily N-acetyltransferase
MLAGFSRRGLIARGRSGTDARARPISLTPRGRAAFAPLDRRSHEQVTAILRPLSIAERRRLAAAMQSIEQILDPADFPRTRRAASSGTPFTLRALEPGDIGWITHRQELLYFEEYGWNEEFEALIARIMAEYVERHDTKMENCWIAEHGGRTAGAVFVMKRSATVAQLRLLYVEPGARGLGIGRRLVDECIRFARARRYRRMILWTNSVLVSARRIYEAAGFTLTKSERHHSFGKDLVGQYWTKQL